MGKEEHTVLYELAPGHLMAEQQRQPGEGVRRVKGGGVLEGCSWQRKPHVQSPCGLREHSAWGKLTVLGARRGVPGEVRVLGGGLPRATC